MKNLTILAGVTALWIVAYLLIRILQLVSHIAANL